MPRKPRFFLPDVPIHMILRGNNKQLVFAEDQDYLAYLRILSEGAEALECRIHAYVLMSNHIHLLLSASNIANLSRLSQHIGRHYVPYFNHKYGNSGTLWESRFKATSIDSERYLFHCYRYIELNPVRANMVKHPRHYRWSSYRGNAESGDNTLITPHEEYLSLGRTHKLRAERYTGKGVSTLFNYI